MLKSMKQRVMDAFDNSDGAEIERFMDLTLSSWRQLSDSITRTVVFIFLLAGVFEILVDTSSIKSLTLGPLTFSNTSLFQLFIPALVAYLLYDVWSLVTRWRDHGAIYFAIVNRFEPKLFESDLPLMVAPVIRGPWSLGPAFAKYTDRPTDTFEIFMRVILLIVGGIILPLAFEFQAYYTLVYRYGAGDILIWVSAAAAVFFIFAWIMRIYLTGVENYSID
jgi:hypothetical protein